MANDVFDYTSIESGVEAMKQLQQQSQKTASSMKDIETAMRMVGQARAQFKQVGSFMDAKNAREAVKLMKEFEQNIIAAGGSYQELLDMRKNEMELIGAEIVSMENLTRKQRMYAMQQANAQTQKKKIVQIGGKNVDVTEALNKSQSKITNQLKQQGRQLSGFMQSTTGVQLSLVGILALLLDIHNETRRIGAMSKQVAAQWDYLPVRTKEASKMMGELQGTFRKTYDVAGAYLNSLSSAGLTLEQTKRLNKEILAVQELQGQSAESQVSNLKNLMNNFGRTDIEAQSYLRTLRLASTEMKKEGGVAVSMEEVVNDVMELSDKTKAYRGDLLGVLAMFNALARKDVAERLGLGDAPLKIRKEIGKTVAGFSAELDEGWKAALGEGSNIASRILNFEMMDVPEQFAKMAEFIMEKTSQFTGDTRQIAIRNLLKQFGFTSQEVRKVLSESFAEGGLDAEGIRAVMGEIGTERNAMKNIEQKAARQRKALIAKGAAVSTGLTSLQDIIKQKVRNWLREYVTPLAAAIRDLIDAINNFNFFGTPGSKRTTETAGISTIRQRLKATGSMVGAVAEPASWLPIEASAKLPSVERRVSKERMLRAYSDPRFLTDPAVMEFAKKHGMEKMGSGQRMRQLAEASLAAMSTNEVVEYIDLISKKNTEGMIMAMLREFRDKRNMEKAYKDVQSGYESTTSSSGKPTKATFSVGH